MQAMTEVAARTEAIVVVAPTEEVSWWSDSVVPLLLDPLLTYWSSHFF